MRKNDSTLDLQNAEQQKAFELVANTNTSLFITGKAGTGKTAFFFWLSYASYRSTYQDGALL